MLIIKSILIALGIVGLLVAILAGIIWITIVFPWFWIILFVSIFFSLLVGVVYTFLKPGGLK